MRYSCLLNYASAAFLSVWGFIIVRNDLKTRKIPNAMILSGLKFFAAAIFLSGLITVVGLYSGSTGFLSLVFYKGMLIHCGMSLAAAVALWYFEIWPAGDAKFFIASSFLLPLANPELRGFPGYLWISELINIFVTAALFSLAAYVYVNLGYLSNGKGEAFRELKNMFSEAAGQAKDRKKLLSFVYAFLGLSGLFITRQVIKIEVVSRIKFPLPRLEIIYFLVFFGWEKLAPLFSGKKARIAVVLFYALYAAAGLAFFRSSFLLHLKGAALNLAGFSVILVFGRFLLAEVMTRKNERFLTAEDLKPGLIPDRETIALFRKDEFFEGLFDDFFRDGLNADQVEKIKAWLKRDQGGERKIRVVEARSFGFWVFAGIMINLVLNRNILKLTELFR